MKHKQITDITLCSYKIFFVTFVEYSSYQEMFPFKFTDIKNPFRGTR
jgi:hypothetical protein